MGILISWLAIAAILLLACLVLKKIFRFLARRREARVPSPEEVADVAEDIAAATRIAAALASAAAYFAAPAGLLALAAAMGMAPQPLIVTLVPALLVIAFGAAALSAAAKLYAKSRRSRK